MTNTQEKCQNNVNLANVYRDKLDLIHNGGYDEEKLGREHQSEIVRHPEEERAETDFLSHAIRPVLNGRRRIELTSR